MTKLKNGIFGPISGKLGPVVGATWKGIAYLRLAPNKNKKSVPRSAAQLANQYKFKFLHAFLTPFHPYLINGFKHSAIGKTEINAAFTANYKAVKGVYPDFEINYSELSISEGRLANLNNPTTRWISQSAFELSWETGNQIQAAFNDQLMVVIYCPELKIADGFVGGVKRSSKKYIYTLDEKFIGLDLEVYVCMLALTGKAVSKTAYLGRMVAI
ncbi:hypothetical protein G6M26_25685 [Agrobacterium tumefaciens]|nr:hypothetical protein [Agrobacterium tumefaciens]NTE21941.1 hypothetical protein [Agrobacterium tumefaciens]